MSKFSQTESCNLKPEAISKLIKFKTETELLQIVLDILIFSEINLTSEEKTRINEYKS